ncbi:MAG TPA: hypothetical protein VIG24_14960 [Acidimicrobiia bacterium]
MFGTRSRVLSRSAALGAALALAFGGLAATSASSAPITTRTWVAAPNGLVGVQQTVIVRAPRSAGSVATVTFTNAAGTNAGQAALNANGFAYLPWTPSAPGAWTVSASVNGTSVGSSNIVVAAMPTSTILLTPGEVQENATTTIVAEVEALGGSITPSGTVTVRNQSNAVVATGTLTPTSTPGRATADISWTPVPGPVTLTATFNPATPTFTASTSPAQSPAVAGAQAVSLRMPPVAYVGVPETVGAVIQPQFQSPLGGSVAFNLNIDGFIFFPMGGSQPISGGVGTAQWVPGQAGVQTVGVQYASANFAINGRDTQVIRVLPAPAPDAITVTPTGAGPWVPGNMGTLTQGNTVELTPTSQSGNPVTLSTDGPCAANAGTVTMLGPGTCAITARSLGNGGTLKADEQTYTVTIQAAPRKRR